MALQTDLQGEMKLSFLGLCLIFILRKVELTTLWFKHLGKMAFLKLLCWTK